MTQSQILKPRTEDNERPENFDGRNVQDGVTSPQIVPQNIPEQTPQLSVVESEDEYEEAPEEPHSPPASSSASSDAPPPPPRHGAHPPPVHRAIPPTPTAEPPTAVSPKFAVSDQDTLKVPSASVEVLDEDEGGQLKVIFLPRIKLINEPDF